ncbi:lamin tail domain-containing protein [Myxococcota bacterium]|nr:lamin tail domain-containing protein [Myxococcota bacterium]MBU1380551.1 lamin tail domain-containing protein [Myxococcota bacterium]MBU1497136.1 lamin tail domain-containing protein [Myxococcota bacterium]
MLRKLLVVSLLATSAFAMSCDPDEKSKDEICNNQVDDDGDGLVDCADPQCAGMAGGANGELCQSTESRCNDGFDNDGDGQTDCLDTDCASSTECSNTETICNDGQDNDGDGETDCDDDDCADATNCQAGSEICDNEQDDDGDGDVDCDDDDCAAHAHCATAEVCNDGSDNDGDTLVDCQDPDCNGQPGPTVETISGTCQTTESNCDDSYDNDGDGDVDCEDSDCDTNAACVAGEICNNGIDDDGDSAIDCADPECDGETNGTGVVCESVETTCDDGDDNDGDGLVDCADSDCTAACISAGDLVITELLKDPNTAADNKGEWFEIHNASALAIDLRGLVIYSMTASSEATHTITSANPVTVAAGGYIVLGLSSDTGENGGVAVDYVYTSLAFSNSGIDNVGIRTAGGTVIDVVAFDDINYHDFAGMSLSLSSTALNATDNDVAANWCYVTAKFNADEYGTPGAANPSCARETNCSDTIDNDGNGDIDCADFACAFDASCTSAAVPTASDLIVTEIMINTGTLGLDYEWFEVYNTTSGPIELNGLTICDSDATQYCFFANFGASHALAAGSYALFARAGANLPAGVTADYSYGTALQFADTSDGIQIFAGASLIDAVLYDGWAAIQAGASIQFSANATQNATENNSAGNWCTSADVYDATNNLLGTPKMANNPCAVESNCADGTDNDGDGAIDCADSDCVGVTGPDGVACEATETTCGDGNDNDGDGDTDCADSDCVGVTGPDGVACEATETSCSDTFDNDGDGFVDMADPDCNIGATVDLTGYRIEVWVNINTTPILGHTMNLTGNYVKGKYIAIVRNQVDLAAWGAGFNPILTTAETENISEYVTTADSWQPNGNDSDRVRIYDDTDTLIDEMEVPSNSVKTRQSDNTTLIQQTTAGAVGAPNSVTGYTHPIYIYEIGEAGTGDRLTAFQSNYTLIYIPNI